jgi:hypothetical protein
MADWFMPPVNHLHDLKKRMALPGAIRKFRHGKLSGLRCLGGLDLSLSGPDLIGIPLKTFPF